MVKMVNSYGILWLMSWLRWMMVKPMVFILWLKWMLMDGEDGCWLMALVTDGEDGWSIAMITDGCCL